MKVPLGTRLPGGGGVFVVFEIAEDHPNWSELRALLQRWDVSAGHIRTKFSAKEIDSARWLEIGAWHHGYPQPDEDVFGYHQATYDLRNWCQKCGIGLVQRAPFQMKREPRWGRNGVMQMIWVYDELFVRPEVWSEVFEPHSVACRPVRNVKGVVLGTVVQLVIEEEVGIVTDGLASERCEKCRRVKYLPVSRGPFPALKAEPARGIARTKEYFGSGGQADKGVLISQELARSLAAAKVRGASLTPVQSQVGIP